MLFSICTKLVTSKVKNALLITTRLLKSYNYHSRYHQRGNTIMSSVSLVSCLLSYPSSIATSSMHILTQKREFLRIRGCQFSGYCWNSGFFIFFAKKSGAPSFIRLERNRLYRVRSVSLWYQDVLNFSFFMPSGLIHSDISPTEGVSSLRWSRCCESVR